MPSIDTAGGFLTDCIIRFHVGDHYHIETSPLICFTNQWTGFYMIRTSIIKEFNVLTFYLANLYHAIFRKISITVDYMMQE